MASPSPSPPPASSPSLTSALTPPISVSSLVGVTGGNGSVSSSSKQVITILLPKECEGGATLTVQDNKSFTHRGAVPVVCVFENPCTITSITIRNAGTPFFTFLVGDSDELALLKANIDRPTRRNEILGHLCVLMSTSQQLPPPSRGVGDAQLGKPKIFRNFSAFTQQSFTGVAFLVVLCEPFYDGPMEVGVGWINVLGQRVNQAKRTDNTNTNSFFTDDRAVQEKQRFQWTLKAEDKQVDQQQQRQQFAQRFYAHTNEPGRVRLPAVARATHPHTPQPRSSLPTSNDVPPSSAFVGSPKCSAHGVECVERYVRPKQQWLYMCGIQSLDPSQTPCGFSIARDEWRKQQARAENDNNTMQE